MSLLEASQKIVSATNPAAQVQLADRYMRLWAADPKAFVLPRKHAHLAPVLAAYADRFDAFRRFVRALRDEARSQYGAESSQYEDLQRLVRVFDVRAAQAKRRERLTGAADWIRETRPDLSADQRRYYIRKLEQQWAAERIDQLREHKQRKGDRLTTYERDDILEAFWQELSQRVADKQLPTYEELVDAVELHSTHQL